MASFGTTSGDRCHHQGRAASGHASCAPIRRHSSWRSLRLLRRSRRPLSSNNLSCLMHVVTCAQGVHDVCAADEKDDELRLRAAAGGDVSNNHCTRRAGSAGDSRTSQRTSGERRLCDLSVRHGQHLLPMAALGRLQHDLTATSDDLLLVLGGHSASAAGRAIGDTVRTHRVCC